MIGNLEDYRWLVGEPAAALLVRLADDLRAKPASPAQIRALRTEAGTARATLLLEQVELRRRAVEKFPQAERMFFTRRGFEQATEVALADYKALAFENAGELADLCCGIGGDAISLSREHPLRLVDRDEICLLLAAANCERLGGVAITRHCESVALQHVTEVDAWHLDPDRRTGDARTSRAELAEPGLETIEQLRQANPHGAIKLAPAAEAPEVWQEAGNREWIETRGECRQQMVWLGSLASEPGSSQATLLDVATGEAASFRGDATIPLSVADSIGPFVFDPAPSLVAARLTGALAEVLGLASLAAQSLYLTGPHAVQHPLLQSFAVEAEMPLDVRQLRSYFQLRGVGRLEIKKRGVTLTPETLRPQLQLRGDAAATLLLTRIGQRTTALVCQRI